MNSAFEDLVLQLRESAHARAVWMQSVPIFASAPLETLELFAGHMELREYTPGQVICEQGDPGEHLYLVVRGETSVLIKHEDQVVSKLVVGESHCLGEMAVLANQPRSATVTAGERGVELLVIPGDHFRKLLILQPTISVRMLDVLSQRMNDQDLKRQNARLAKEKQASDAQSVNRRELLASMSHELRTPLNGIIGLTELLLDTQVNSIQKEYLHMVRESGENLLELINDILDLSKIEAGSLTLEQAPFGLRASLGEILRPLAVRAHRNGLELMYRVRPDVPDVVIGDIGRLRQVIVNLVGNAIKFTETGEIVLDVQIESQSEGQIELHFTVRDTGIGIPQESCELIFQPYQQAEASTSRKYGGTGLGLSICQQLVTLMGGRIWVESQLGQGSRFQFTAVFGVEPQSGPQDESLFLTKLRGRQALLATEQQTLRTIIEELFTQWQITLSTVSKCEDISQFLQKFAEQPENLSAVLIDSKLCDAELFTILEKIQSDDRFAGKVIVLMNPVEYAEIRRCDQIHVSYLLKPLQPGELFETLAATKELDKITNDQPAEPASEPAQQSYRILLAEDSLVNQKLAAALLKQAGHDVQIANNGQEAVLAVTEGEFDLVLMDMLMPELDGISATAAIRAHEQQTGNRIPIIAMTAHTSQEAGEQCLAAGMDDFLSKPVRPAELYEIIQKVCGRPRETPSKQAVVLDLEKALAVMGGKQHRLEDLARLMLTESSELVGEIESAIASNNPAKLCLAAHTLKCSMSIFGATRVIDAADALEKTAGLTNLHTAQEELEKLKVELDVVQAALRALV